jgi:AcrR family transcriptional regulator
MSNDLIDPPVGGRPTEDRELRAQGRRTVRRLLDAGRDAIADRGFPNVRVDDIADRAETSHGTFYLYFANKDDLLETLARESADALAALADRLPRVSSDADGREALRGWLDEFAAVQQVHGPVLRAWLESQPAEGGVRDDLVAPVREAFATRVRETGRQDLDPDAAAFAVVAMVERSVHLLVEAADRDTELDTLAAIAHRGVFGG